MEPTYKVMYFKLFNRITDIIDLLQQVQIQCEDMAIGGDEVADFACPDGTSAIKNNDVHKQAP